VTAIPLATWLLVALAQTTPAVPAPKAATPVPRSETLESLIRSELAFSKASVEKGMREAFLTFLDDDGIVFRPHATNGKQLWRARSRRPRR